MMPGTAVGQAAATDVQYSIEGRDELVVLEPLLQQIIYLGKDRSDRVVVSDLGSQKRTKTGHDQRSRNAFTDHIGYHNPKMPLHDRYEIEVVAPDLLRRNVYATEVQTGECWSALRQQAQLHVSRNSQLLTESPLFNQSLIDSSLGKGDGGLRSDHGQPFQVFAVEGVRSIAFQFECAQNLFLIHDRDNQLAPCRFLRLRHVFH